MRYAVGLLLLGACTMTTGCAQSKLHMLTGENALSVHMASDAMTDKSAPPRDTLGERRELRASAITVVERQADDYEEAGEVPPVPTGEEPFVVDDQRPEEVAPEPAGASSFKPGAVEVNIDRFTRRVTEVPLDIRTTAGAMPDDESAAAFPDIPIPSEPGPAPDRVEVPVAYSPWTICYRPLYFEEVALERYGDSHGILQPVISGAHFFGSVAALPYQMTVRPPRSCECSNGFSRPGDCPLDGDGNYPLRVNGALVQAAIVAGIVMALP